MQHVSNFLGVVTWVFVSEIFPNKIRGLATSISVALHWMDNLTISSTFPPLNDLFGGMTFAIYGLISLLSVFFVWKMVPETKGKTLEELEGIWDKKTTQIKKRYNFRVLPTKKHSFSNLGKAMFIHYKSN